MKAAAEGECRPFTCSGLYVAWKRCLCPLARLWQQPLVLHLAPDLPVTEQQRHRHIATMPNVARNKTLIDNAIASLHCRVNAGSHCTPH